MAERVLKEEAKFVKTLGNQRSRSRPTWSRRERLSLRGERPLPARAQELKYAGTLSVGFWHVDRLPVGPPLGAHALPLADLLPLVQAVRALREGPLLRAVRSVIAVARQVQLVQVVEVAEQVLRTYAYDYEYH